MSDLEFEEAFCQTAFSLDPAPDIEMENIEKKVDTIEDTWQISAEEPVRRIKWCTIKVVEETARKMHVFLGGVFERINPLEYRAKIGQNKFISINENNESLIINLPKIKDFSMIIVKPMIGSDTAGDSIISEFITENMKMAFPISSDKLELEYQFDILYLKN